MPTSSESSWTDKTRLEQAFLRLRYQLEKWPDDPRGGERLRARIRRLMKWEFAQLEACLHDPRDLLEQVKAVAEGQMCLIHIDRTEVRNLFEWRAASYERTAQVFGVEPDNLYQFHESVLDAQVECLYRKFDERIEGAEDGFGQATPPPGRSSTGCTSRRWTSCRKTSVCSSSVSRRPGYGRPMVRSYEVNVCEWELRCKTITVTARSPGDAMFEAMDRYTPKPADCAARREGFYGMNGVPRLGRKHMEIVQGYPVCRSIYLSRLGFLGVKEFDMEHVHATLQRL